MPRNAPLPHGLLRYAAAAALSAWLSLGCPVLLPAAEPFTIIVEGVTGQVLQNVREAVTPPAGLVRDGSVDRLWAERFGRQAEARVRTALEPFGYYNARVAATLEPLGNGFRLRIAIEPGEPVRVSQVRVEVQGPGAAEWSLRQLAESFPLRQGSILLQPEYERAKGTLRSQAQSLGYLDADFTVHEIRIAEGAREARITLLLDTGRQYRFGQVTIEGAPDYPDPFLRRHISFREGETFSFAKVGETQLNFTNSERFREVIVTPEKERAQGQSIPVLVRLTQAPRINLRPGIGYGTDTGGRVSLRYRDLNLFHRGHELSALLYLAERLQGLAAGYTLPDRRDLKSSTTLQLNLQREETSSYLSRLGSLELARHRSFGPGQVGTLYLKLQQEEYDIGQQKSVSRLVLPGLRFSQDRYDNLLRPTRGFRYALEVRGTHQLLGSDTGLLQTLAEGSYLLPLPWRLSLHLRSKAGFTMLSGLHDLPPTLRFFAGGDQSVRGYSYHSLGPRDQAGQVVGGKHLVTGSLELERALFANWGISAFYDAGNAFNALETLTVRQGVGIGLHYYSRIGALNLSVARQVAVDQPGYRIHFTVGFEL